MDAINSRITELTSIAEETAADNSKNFRTISDAYQELASCHFCYGNYKMGAYYFEQAFKYRRDYQLDKENARLCILAGLCHYRTGGIIQSERFFGYAVTAAKQANSDYFTCISTSNMALVHLAQGRSSKAIEMASESVQLAKKLFSPDSDELLEFVRVLVTILLQSKKYGKALKAIEENQFSEKESCILQAGIAFISGDTEECLSLLLTALNLRRVVTPCATTSNDIEATEPDDVESAQDERKEGAEGGEAQGLCKDVNTTFDNGKIVDYQYRKEMVECLIDYNLHVAYARLGKVDLEKNHLDTASDIMFRIILKAERESKETAARRVSEGENEKTVFPPLDTTMAPYIVAHHCNIAKISNRITVLPMVSSIAIQSGTVAGESDENAVVMSACADLSALVLPWNADPQIDTMIKLHEVQVSNPSAKPKVLHQQTLAAMDSTAADSQLSDGTGGEDHAQMQDTDNVDMQLTHLAVSDTMALIDLVKHKTAEMTSSDVLSRATSFMNTPIASPRNSPAVEQIPEKKKKSKKDKDKPGGVKKQAKNESKAKESDGKVTKSSNVPKKKPKATVKVKSKIATHGSVKLEMMPHCHPTRVEGITDYDKTIQEATILCHGVGLGFMNTTGIEIENTSLAEDTDAEYVEYCDQIAEAKRQLLDIAEAIESSEAISTDIAAKNNSITGTKLSMYAALTNMCTLLNQRKEAGTYMQRFCEVADVTNMIEYQAMGCRMQLDYEEWVSAPTLSQMVSSQKLTRLQGVLSTAKKYFCYAEKAAQFNEELYFDAWRRLVNTYTEISAIPDTPGAPKPPDPEVLEENLALLSPEEIDNNESTDVAWMKLYSRQRAKALSGRLSIAIQASVESSTKRLVNLGA